MGGIDFIPPWFSHDVLEIFADRLNRTDILANLATADSGSRNPALSAVSGFEIDRVGIEVERIDIFSDEIAA